VSKRKPCDNKNCDKCHPEPRWKITEHRIQHITYTREIKAPTSDDALRIFEQGTAWPSSYDDDYGAIVQQDQPEISKLPPNPYFLEDCCGHENK